MSAVQKLRVAWWLRLNHRLQYRQWWEWEEEAPTRWWCFRAASSSLSATPNTPYTNKRRMRARNSKSQSIGNSMNPPRSKISYHLSMDATSYLAWVNQQTEALPNLFFVTNVVNQYDEASYDKKNKICTHSCKWSKTKITQKGGDLRGCDSRNSGDGSNVFFKTVILVLPPTVRCLTFPPLPNHYFFK